MIKVIGWLYDPDLILNFKFIKLSINALLLLINIKSLLQIDKLVLIYVSLKDLLSYTLLIYKWICRFWAFFMVISTLFLFPTILYQMLPVTNELKAFKYSILLRWVLTNFFNMWANSKNVVLYFISEINLLTIES